MKENGYKTKRSSLKTQQHGLGGEGWGTHPYTKCLLLPPLLQDPEPQEKDALSAPCAALR